MDVQRSLLVIAFLFVSFMILQAWQEDQAFKFSTKRTQKTTNTAEVNFDNSDIMFTEKGQLIIVKTDVLLLKINTYGGDIEEAFLLSYPKKLGSTQPFHLLETSNEFVYQAQSGLIKGKGSHNSTNEERHLYTTNKRNYILKDGQDELCVPLIYSGKNGVMYTKIFLLRRGEFSLHVNYVVKNTSSLPFEVMLCGRLKQSIDLPNAHNNNNENFALHAYRGAAYSTTNNKYHKYNFKDIKRKRLVVTTESGWIAMLQKYFATAWIPLTKGKNNFYTSDLSNGRVAISFQSAPFTVSTNSEIELKSILWLGPEIQDKMASIAPYLDLTVDYGWLWFLSQPLFKILKFIHHYIGNWGFSIIIITFIVRSIMYPLTKAQYTSMAKMRILQPKLMAIRSRLVNDKQRQSQEIMALYKAEKVNPLGGCLPLVVQMPIFLALYYMLSGSVELRHAPFILWIHDLSAADPYYILPMLMGVTMFFIQKMSPTAVTDPVQKKIMTFIPVVFILFFLWFPSGLVLYYIVSNLVTILQQQLIYRSLEKNGLHSKE